MRRRPGLGHGPCSTTCGSSSKGVVGTTILPLDDVCLVVVELVLDVVEVATGRRVADAVDLQVEGVDAALGVALGAALIVSNTATSTCLSIEVRMYVC